ncbi:response regulator [Dyadobacter sp. CY326]|uniref:response regulator n=1 Tax=Dyadobacter sp. CY326 TaxID=2907300 RepID=UPI001F183817|nr:response regulator [Dyadobacter sp. CY326]MCE7066988.1 response regulator [Dyadobacter sp. CY326]
MNQFKLVIVENDEDERFFMNEAFQESEEFQILGAFENGDTLIEWLDQTNASDQPEIILSDLNMPGKNGYDILTHVQAHPEYAHITVIITSTSTVVSIREKCLSLGAKDYLVKPEIFIDYSDYVKNLYQLVSQHK